MAIPKNLPPAASALSQDPPATAQPKLPDFLKELVRDNTDIKGKIRVTGFNTYDPKVPNSRKDFWTVTVSSGSGKDAQIQEFVCSDLPKGKGSIIEKDKVQIQKTEHPVDN